MHRFFDSILVRGLLVGLVATEALDGVSIALYRKEGTASRLREDAARGFEHVYEKAVQKMAHAVGGSLSRREKKAWGWRFHKAFGLVGGVLYAMLRRRRPRIGAGMGLAFGAAFFLVGDELMMPLLGLSPGPRAFSWKVHARGAIAHVAYGLAAEATWRALDRVAVDAPTPQRTDVTGTARVVREHALPTRGA